MNKKNIESSEYRLLSEEKDTYQNISMKHIFDVIYSAFSLDVIKTYFLLLANSEVKQPKDLKKNIVLSVDNVINDAYLKMELSNWILLQKKHPSNKNSFLPIHFSDYQFLEQIIQHFLLHHSDFHGIKIEKKKLDKTVLNILKKLSLENTIRKLYENHTPPFMIEEPSKEYVIKKTNDYDSNYNQTINILSLEKQNNIFSKVTDNLSVIYEIKGSENMFSLFLKMYFSKEEYVMLKKKFIPKNKIDMNETLYTLMTFYFHFGFLDGMYSYARNPIQIKNKTFLSYHKKAVELIGTPFTSEKKYFSLFPEIETHFGSIGSFFKAEPLKGTYSLRPPHSFVFTHYCLDRVEGWLQSAKKENRKLTFLFWIPYFFLKEYSIFSNSKVHLQIKNKNKLKMIFEYANDSFKKRIKEKVSFFYPSKEDFFYKVYIMSTSRQT
jgi:hypothetical protein